MHKEAFCMLHYLRKLTVTQKTVFEDLFTKSCSDCWKIATCCHCFDTTVLYEIPSFDVTKLLRKCRFY